MWTLMMPGWAGGGGWGEVRPHPRDREGAGRDVALGPRGIPSCWCYQPQALLSHLPLPHDMPGAAAGVAIPQTCPLGTDASGSRGQ